MQSAKRIIAIVGVMAAAFYGLAPLLRDQGWSTPAAMLAMGVFGGGMFFILGRLRLI